jgi:hypothetical protein
MLEHWYFDRRPDGAEWSWTRMNDEDGITTQCSDRSFPTLTECMQDAVTHGYGGI